MKRPLRCRLGLHKWVLKQDTPDGGRYHGCARCDRMQESEYRPQAFPPML